MRGNIQQFSVGNIWTMPEIHYKELTMLGRITALAPHEVKEMCQIEDCIDMSPETKEHIEDYEEPLNEDDILLDVDY